METIVKLLLGLTSVAGLGVVIWRGWILLAANHLDWPKADNVDSLETAARHEIVRLERGLVVLEIIVGIAPLLGLVGTIIGMITVFGDIGQSGLNDASKLASGISYILWTTLRS